jgi:very-short-patch-repair endonuclease
MSDFDRAIAANALISHRAAAALWGIDGFNKATPEITIPRGRKYRRSGVRAHESTDLDRCTPPTNARRGRPGIRRLRRVIAGEAHRIEITDSDFELLVIALIREHGLPEPVVHHVLRAADGRFIAEIDLSYPRLKIAIELDGKVHQSDEAFERDRPRQNRIALEGWTILRFTWAMFQDHPEEIVREVHAAIAAAQAR